MKEKQKNIKGLEIGWTLSKQKKELRTKTNCKKCGEEMSVTAFRLKNGRGKFCSKKCKGEWWKGKKHPNPRKTQGENKKCLKCGKEFYVPKSQLSQNYCSSKCRYLCPLYRESISGKNAGTWKGGRMMIKGYVYTHSPKHPHRNSGNYVAEHRLVMERHLGRYLLPTEDVHHINKKKDDNRIENLKIVCHSNHFNAVRCPYCEKDFLLK